MALVGIYTDKLCIYPPIRGCFDVVKHLLSVGHRLRAAFKRSAWENIQERVAELNTLVRQLKFDEALDKFYSEDITSVENENPSIIGLADYREAAKKFMANLSNYSAELKNVIVSDDMSVTEWHYKFDHATWGKWDAMQIPLQRWKNGKIVHERHHYRAEK